MNKKVILMILDGWGITQDPKVSAVEMANTPFLDSLYKKYPTASLRTDGLNVGLPEGQMGNSEVGHMNLGAGRIVFQDFAKINNALKDGTFQKEKAIVDAFTYAKEKKKNIHFLGLVSDGGIHSHINHLKGLLKAADDFGLKNVFLHAFTDGRDCDPKSGKGFISEIENFMSTSTGKLATITGRYYAMDRDNRWERIKLAYDVIVNAKGTKSYNAAKSIQESYDADVTDEFIKPIVMVDSKEQPITNLNEDDVVIYFNFRTDRGRELTQALSQQDFPDFNMHKLKLYFVTMGNYDSSFSNISVIYPKDNLHDTLGEILEKNNKKQIRIAETEKYPHVTYFFSGGREKEFNGEKRILIPSPKVATYDLQPEMSAYKIKDALLPELKNKTADFVCLNFANGDMVGHTGVLKAAIKACEVVDECVKEVVTTALENDYAVIIIADHGNCEKMINEDGTPNTSHTTFPVPITLVSNDYKGSIKNGVLANIAPTILEIIGIKQPEIMNEKSLLS